MFRLFLLFCFIFGTNAQCSDSDIESLEDQIQGCTAGHVVRMRLTLVRQVGDDRQRQVRKSKYIHMFEI